MMLALALIALQTMSTTQAPPFPLRPAQPRIAPNIVLIVADDFGVDLMASYGEGLNQPCTPSLDGLSASGMLFRNAWAAPLCSPARAQILTGRYGFRTGLGMPVSNVGPGLGLAELTLPEMLASYESRIIGKWHLAGSLPDTHPNDSGFDAFAGSPANLSDYDSWTKVVDGQSSTSTTYATTDTADEAIAALLGMQAPWFLSINFNAPHSPLHAPDISLCPSSCGNFSCASVTSRSPGWHQARAMVSAMDFEIGRIMTALNAVDPDAYVVFLGDNGTGENVTRPPFVSAHAKGTLYEGGINVPLIVKGPGVIAGAECGALVSAVDLFATFAQLARRRSAAEDSVSLVPYFTNPGLSLRTTVFAESFSPNHQVALPYDAHERAIRDSRYKLIRRTGEPDELYDLLTDPWESSNLVPLMSVGSPEEAAYLNLVSELGVLGVS